MRLEIEVNVERNECRYRISWKYCRTVTATLNWIYPSPKTTAFSLLIELWLTVGRDSFAGIESPLSSLPSCLLLRIPARNQRAWAVWIKRNMIRDFSRCISLSLSLSSYSDFISCADVISASITCVRIRMSRPRFTRVHRSLYHDMRFVKKLTVYVRT
jgi:hypothetical protein